jgi:hypothetical protein
MIYYTGDKDWLLLDNIVCLGRMDGDNQIKLGRFLIELDDIANKIPNTTKVQRRRQITCMEVDRAL